MSPIEAKFWKCAVVMAGCWSWKGKRHKRGYSILAFGKRYWIAHRYAYELIIGPIPPNTVLHHECKVRGCVNPYHLKPLSREEHTRYHNPPKQFCKHGHELKGEAVLYDGDGRRHCRYCQRRRAKEQYLQKRFQYGVDGIPERSRA